MLYWPTPTEVSRHETKAYDPASVRPIRRLRPNDRSLDRTGVLPKPMVINRIRFWDESEIEERDRQRMGAAKHDNAA